MGVQDYFPNSSKTLFNGGKIMDNRFLVEVLTVGDRVTKGYLKMIPYLA